MIQICFERLCVRRLVFFKGRDLVCLGDGHWLPCQSFDHCVRAVPWRHQCFWMTLLSHEGAVHETLQPESVQYCPCSGLTRCQEHQTPPDS